MEKGLELQCGYCKIVYFCAVNNTNYRFLYTIKISCKD